MMIEMHFLARRKKTKKKKPFKICSSDRLHWKIKEGKKGSYFPNINLVPNSLYYYNTYRFIIFYESELGLNDI
jgi:hypothetical protein